MKAYRKEHSQILNNSGDDLLFCFGFDVLPNELMLKILKKYLDPLWTVVCNSICHRWNQLLAFLANGSEVKVVPGIK